jgi:hypothetical protein
MQLKKHFTLRGLLEFKSAHADPLEEVESVESLLQALQERGHELRFHQPGSPRSVGYRP